MPRLLVDGAFMNGDRLATPQLVDRGAALEALPKGSRPTSHPHRLGQLGEEAGLTSSPGDLLHQLNPASAPPGGRPAWPQYARHLHPEFAPPRRLEAAAFSLVQLMRRAGFEHDASPPRRNCLVPGGPRRAAVLPNSRQRVVKPSGRQQKHASRPASAA